MTGHRKGETQGAVAWGVRGSWTGRCATGPPPEWHRSTTRSHARRIVSSALATDADLEASTVHPQRARDLRGASEPHVACHRSAVSPSTVKRFRCMTYDRVPVRRLPCGSRSASPSRHGFLGHFTLAVTLESNAIRSDARTRNLGRTKPTPTALRREQKLSTPRRSLCPTSRTAGFAQCRGCGVGAPGRDEPDPCHGHRADDYDLMSKLVEAGRRWVIRLCYDRVLATADQPAKNERGGRPTRGAVQQNGHLSRRSPQPGAGRRKRGAARQQRVATLAISASR